MDVARKILDSFVDDLNADRVLVELRKARLADSEILYCALNAVSENRIGPSMGYSLLVKLIR